MTCKSDKELARLELKQITSDSLSTDLNEQIRILLLYVVAEEPIPVEFLSLVDSVCTAYSDADSEPEELTPEEFNDLTKDNCFYGVKAARAFMKDGDLPKELYPVVDKGLQELGKLYTKRKKEEEWIRIIMEVMFARLHDGKTKNDAIKLVAIKNGIKERTLNRQYDRHTELRHNMENNYIISS
jgi:hypothetical protein